MAIAAAWAGWGSPPRSQLASDQLDRLWDDWMKSLSRSNVRTSDLLDEGKSEDAAREFQVHFVPTVKKLFAEAGKMYPVRFSKVQDWCAWTKELYELTRNTEDALKANQTEEAREKLDSVRAHFYKLHQQTQTQRINDYIFAFETELQEKRPNGVRLKDLLASFESAPLSAQAQADGAAYEKKMTAWKSKASRMVNDGKVGFLQRWRLRRSTEKVYREFGLEFE